jgi:WD40 repeat protein
MVPDLYEDTKHIFVGSETGIVHHLKLGNPTIEQIQIHPGKHPQSKIVSIVKYSPFKNVLVASGGDGRMHVWENML